MAEPITWQDIENLLQAHLPDQLPDSEETLIEDDMKPFICGNMTPEQLWGWAVGFYYNIMNLIELSHIKGVDAPTLNSIMYGNLLALQAAIELNDPY